MKRILFILLIIHTMAIFSQCPNDIVAPNANNNPITVYIYDENDSIIGTGTCNQAGGSGNFNCQNVLNNLPPGASYLSFGNLENGDNGDCIYDTSGGLIIGTALPIELKEFKVHEKDGTVVVNWVTVSEINNDYFTIERSNTGYIWNSITEVNGAGNSSKELRYKYIDVKPFPGINYYKIIQTDFDGKYEEFPPKSVIIPKRKKKLIKKLNIMGQEVHDSYTGIVIYYYDDGSIKKIYKQ